MNLFNFARNGEQVTNACLNELKSMGGVYVIASGEQCVFIHFTNPNLKAENRQAVWCISDNGGEINVERVNDHMSCTSIATDTDLCETAEKAACMIWDVLVGMPPNYNFQYGETKIEKRLK